MVTFLDHRAPYRVCTRALHVSLLFIQVTTLCNSVCTGLSQVIKSTWRIEFVIDYLWVFNMFMNFTTAFYKDVELQYELNVIARNYVFSLGFLVDCCTTVPTLVTNYHMPLLYCIKVLRFYFVFKMRSCIVQ